jgi:hypothetical protein
MTNDLSFIWRPNTPRICLAAELSVETITPFEALRAELIARYSVYWTKEARFCECRNPIYPV